ncbi:MAG: hypothetical protein AMXMBFR36_28850 [Acidobacteriota bacterium]
MDADRTRSAGEDLEFVRRALARESRAPFPRSIALLWAGIALVGFPLLDFAREWAPPFWSLAGPVGFGISLWLGGRSARAAGLEDRTEAARWSAHWLGLVIAIGLVVVAAIAGRLDWETTGSTILLLLATTYYGAGVHLHRGLLPVAALLAAGYLLVLFLDGKVWTWIGVATAAALVASSLVPARTRRA